MLRSIRARLARLDAVGRKKEVETGIGYIANQHDPGLDGALP